MNRDEDHPELPTAGPSAPEEATASARAVSPENPAFLLAPEDYPNVDNLITEDDTPLDSIYTEKQLRLLTEPLYSSWAGPGEGRPFAALANVGLFYAVGQPPFVPDAMLSLDVRIPDDMQEKNNRSYFAWVVGKMPDVIVELVSDRRGGEDTLKLRAYARLGIPYYVIFDPANLLDGGVLRVLELHGRRYQPMASAWMDQVGLGLTLWQGMYEDGEALWLRWCDREGQVIPTGRELAEQERQRTEQERQRTEQQTERVKRLEAQLRALGIEPSS
jgi:Uma2 family endonuclease